uniref:Putative p116 rho-interacting protein n=1 Tax=Amblyomma triste TaxID=251400 RepID=A0A023G947_AMBTT
MDQRLQSALEQPKPMARPRICLQTEAPDGHGVVDGWSSLSLATSVTDLCLPEHGGEAPPASYKECLESLDSRLDSLLGWLHEAMTSLREAGVMGSFPKAFVDRIGTRDSEGDHKERLARNLSLLQDIGSKLTVAAGFNAHFFGNMAMHLRETSLVLFAFEERLDQVACSHDLRLVTSENDKSWDPLAEETVGRCQTLGEHESARDAEVVATEIEELSSRLKSLGGALERFNKSRQILVLRRLSECLDIHPTSDLEPDALQNVTEQEAVLGAVMEALAAARTHVSDSLCQSLCSTSGTISAAAAKKASLLRQLEGAMREEFLKVRAELRTSCLSELESYCSANLPRDVLNRELVPVVRDLATANFVAAVLRAYVPHIEEVVRHCEMALHRDGQTAVSHPAEAEVGEMAQELCDGAMALVEGAPSLLRLWLTQCLVVEDLCGAELHAAGACVNSTADVTDALQRLGARLHEEREGHRQRVLALQDRLDATQRDCERLLKSGCATCRGLREQAKALAQRTAELERAAREGTLCERCPSSRSS